MFQNAMMDPEALAIYLQQRGVNENKINVLLSMYQFGGIEK